MILCKDPHVFRDQICRHALKLDFCPTTDERFRATITPVIQLHSGLRVVRLSHPAGVMSRDATLLKESSYSLTLIIVGTGSTTVEHLGDTLEVAQGEATLLLNWEQGRMSSAARAQRIGIIVPFDNADLSRSEIDRLAARRWPNTAALKLLRSYVSALATVPEREEAIEAATERHLVELVGLAARAALREDIAQHQEWWSKRLQTARETMARRFMDSKLDAATVAGEQGISTRYLQKLFERSGTRFVQELNDMRLRAAFEKLNNRHYGESTIMDIAMSSGFGDISHFNRLFRARYGESPTKIRRSR